VRGCPHSDIRFCPLYVASHDGSGQGCMDGDEVLGGCAVSRGMDYGKGKARIAARDPLMVADREWRELTESRGLGAAN